MADVRSTTGVPSVSDFAVGSANANVGTPIVVDRSTATAYILDDSDTVQSIGGGGGGAPTNAQYVTLALNASLTAERVLTAGAGISITDGGANGPVTIASTAGGNSVTATLAFGASFTDKAQTVVTGQTWVAAGSEIVAQVMTPSGTDPDEMRLLEFEPVISDFVAGTGFTVTLYSEPEARGDYSVMCIGV